VQNTIKLAEVINVNDVARLLNIPTRTVYLLAESGNVPGFRFQGTWRFHKGEVIEAFLKHLYHPAFN